LESFVTGSRHALHYDRASRFAWFLLKNYWLRRRRAGPARLESGLWAIDNFSPDNYHHWMIDVLPRLLRAEEVGPGGDVLVLPRYYAPNSYIAFTLRAFPNVARIHWISPRFNTRVSQLTFVPRQTGARRLAQLQEVVRRVAELAGEPGTARRVYFSRADARRRRAHNEADLVRELHAHDFEIVHVDPEKPWEQVRAAAGARLIAGVHGAGLTNLIFMPPGSCLLEFRHGDDGVFFDAYRPLAQDLGIAYAPLMCEVVGDADGLARNDLDIRVDLDKLRERLREMSGVG